MTRLSVSSGKNRWRRQLSPRGHQP